MRKRGREVAAYEADRDGMVLANCECGGSYVRVPVEDVRAGRTGRCSDRCRLNGPVQPRQSRRVK